MSFCEHCIKGVLHEGTPAHKIAQVGGIDAYVAHPSEAASTKGIVVILSDVFGLPFVNSQLLADSYAAEGYLTYLPDLFKGDPLPVGVMNQPGGWDIFEKWFARHDPADIDGEIAVPFMTTLREKHPSMKIAALGFCFGARVGVTLAFSGLKYFDLLSIAHPSKLKLPEELETLKDKFVSQGGAFQVHSCEKDPQFPVEMNPVCDAIFEPFGKAYERHNWEGCTHGFAVRCDLNDPAQRRGKEGAFKQTVAFIRTTWGS